MKKMIIALVLFTSCQLYAQTTMEEYNYITKGYIIQMESGLDMKNGYRLNDHEKVEAGVRSVEIKVLKRVDNSETAAFMLIYQKEGNPKEYICVPHPSSSEEVINEFWYALYDGSDSNENNRLQLITYSLIHTMNWYHGW